jgi:hypothetical protein
MLVELAAAVRGNALRLRFVPAAGVRVEIIERPGRTLHPHELAALIDDCRTVVAACLGGEQLDYGLFAADGAAWRTSVVTLVRDGSGRPIAFNAMPLLPVERGGQVHHVLHLGLVMVDPDARSAGLSWILYGFTCFALFVRGGMRPLWISSVTQVPAVCRHGGRNLRRRLSRRAHRASGLCAPADRPSDHGPQPRGLRRWRGGRLRR